MSRSRKKRILRPARAPAPPRAVPGPLLRQQTMLVRRWALAAIALTWSAWAATGLLTGHMSVLVSPAGPHHYSGIAAVLLMVALLFGAGGVVLAAFEPCATPKGTELPPCLRVRRVLWALAAACFVAAYLADAGEDALWSTGPLFPGLLSGRTLADGLLFDPLLSAVQQATAGPGYGLLWALGWIIAFTIVLALVRAFKVHRVVTVATLLLQWVPVLVLWSAHGVAAIAAGPWANPDRSDLALRVDASWSLTLLVALGGTWLLGIAGCVWMLLRALGLTVEDYPPGEKRR